MDSAGLRAATAGLLLLITPAILWLQFSMVLSLDSPWQRRLVLGLLLVLSFGLISRASPTGTRRYGLDGAFSTPARASLANASRLCSRRAPRPSPMRRGRARSRRPHSAE